MYKSKTSLVGSNVSVHVFEPVPVVVTPSPPAAQNQILSMSPLPCSAPEGTVVFETTWQLFCVRKAGIWNAYVLGSGTTGWTNPGIAFPFGNSVTVAKGGLSAPGEPWEEWSTGWYFEITGGGCPDGCQRNSSQFS